MLNYSASNYKIQLAGHKDFEIGRKQMTGYIYYDKKPYKCIYYYQIAHSFHNSVEFNFELKKIPIFYYKVERPAETFSRKYFPPLNENTGVVKSSDRNLTPSDKYMHIIAKLLVLIA